MHLRVHKYALFALLLLSLGFLLGNSMGSIYRRISRAQAPPPAYLETASEENALAVQNQEKLPLHVAGMLRIDLISGAEAENIIHGYMGREKELTGAYIATYKSNDREVVIYSGELLTPDKGQRVLDAMVAGLKENEAFSDIVLNYVDDDTPVYFTTTGGIGHCFFAREARVIWLTMQAEDYYQAIKDLYLYL